MTVTFRFTGKNRGECEGSLSLGSDDGLVDFFDRATSRHRDALLFAGATQRECASMLRESSGIEGAQLRNLRAAWASRIFEDMLFKLPSLHRVSNPITAARKQLETLQLKLSSMLGHENAHTWHFYVDPRILRCWVARVAKLTNVHSETVLEKVVVQHKKREALLAWAEDDSFQRPETRLYSTAQHSTATGT